MASTFEPNPKRFWRIFIIAMVFMVFMAILIIQRKMEKEKGVSPKVPTVNSEQHEGIRISGTGFPVYWDGQGSLRST